MKGLEKALSTPDGVWCWGRWEAYRTEPGTLHRTFPPAASLQRCSARSPQSRAGGCPTAALAGSSTSHLPAGSAVIALLLPTLPLPFPKGNWSPLSVCRGIGDPRWLWGSTQVSPHLLTCPPAGLPGRKGTDPPREGAPQPPRRLPAKRGRLGFEHRSALSFTHLPGFHSDCISLPCL